MPSNVRCWMAISLLLVSAPALIPAAEEATPGRIPAARLQNLILVADRPTPLFWAEGVTDPEDLPRYRESGLNTVVVPLTADDPPALEAAARLAEAVAGQGLFIIIRLAPSPAGFRGEGSAAIHPSTRSEAYRERVRLFLERAQALRSPSVVAWEVAAVDPDYLLLQQGDFAADLAQWYGDLGKAGQAWGYPELTAGQLTDALPAHLDRNRPQGMGRAVFDLVCHRQQRYRDLLGIWAEGLHRLDPGRLVLAGNVHYYRSALDVPATYDGMVLRCLPTEVEGDLEWHNPHAVDAGRRGNRFAALPTIMVGKGVTPTRVRDWTIQAALHGAAGVGYSDWQYLKDHPDLLQAVTATLKECRERELVPRTPQAQIAVLCEPFAAGAVSRGRGLYGHVGSLSCSEPGGLIYLMRAGTRWGIVDLLSLDDIATQDLQQYRLILAPLALQMTKAARSALLSYMAGGGILMADGECGRFEMPGQPEALNESLSQLFGVTISPAPPGSLLPLVAVNPHPLFPSLGNTTRTLNDPTTSPFTSELLWVCPQEGTRPVVALQQGTPSQFAGIFARPMGKGWAIYGSCRLWEYWLPGKPFFAEMFGDLLGPRADLALEQPGGVLPEITCCLLADGTVMVSDPGVGVASLLLRSRDGRLVWAPGAVQEVPSQPALAPSRITFLRQPLLVMQPIPVEVVALGSRVLVQVGEYKPDRVRLVGFGADSEVHQVGPRLDVAPRGRTRCAFSMLSGVYPIAPGSKHRLEILQSGDAKPAVKTLTADSQGRLRFEVDCGLTYLTVTPA